MKSSWIYFVGECKQTPGESIHEILRETKLSNWNCDG